MQQRDLLRLLLCPFLSLSLSLARRSLVASSLSRDMKRDDEVTSVLSSPRIRLEAESGLLSSITWTRRDIREVSAVSTGERARTSIINRGFGGKGEGQHSTPSRYRSGDDPSAGDVRQARPEAAMFPRVPAIAGYFEKARPIIFRAPYSDGGSDGGALLTATKCT